MYSTKVQQRRDEADAPYDRRAAHSCQAAHTVEIKKNCVAPEWRRLGAGRALLSWLERHAVAAGARQAVLETGVRNTAALSLLTSAGYRPVDRYVDGRDPAINRAFARSLVSPG